MQGIGRPNQVKPNSVPLPPNRAFAYGAMPAAPAPPAPKMVGRKNSRRASRRNNRKNNRKSRNNRKH